MTARRSLAALAPLFALVACGGGGGGTGTSAPPPPATSSGATLSVTLAGGAHTGVDHLWVTVTGIALHKDATRVLGDGDPGWVFQDLPAPVTVDLADPSLTQGQSVSLLKVPLTQLGTYQQLRLIVASSDANITPTTSARAHGLAWNDEVQYTDATGTHSAPLEFPDFGQGIRLLTGFTLSADTTTPVAIEWNAHASLLRRASASGTDRFTLRDELALYNQQLLTALGGQLDGSLFDSITGQLDTSRFCTGTSQSGCIHDVVASAMSLAPDGLSHREVRSVDVGATGTFLLYPLPSDSLYDVVIHGANMRTIVVRDVFVDPTGFLNPFPTALSSTATPLVPTLDTSTRDVAVANALVPGGSRAVFGFTIPGSGGGAGGIDLPYALAWGAADPLTGTVLDAVSLPGGPVLDASIKGQIANGTPPSFTTVTPAEGLDGWTVWAQGPLAYGAGATTRIAAADTTATVPAPARLAGLADGTITVTLTGAPTNGADRAELILTDGRGTVRAVDVTPQIATHGGVVALAATSGVAAGAPAATIYGVALRTWQSATESTSVRWARNGAPVSLEGGASASVALAFP